jgi:methyl-accepting chemotaxis protein
MRDTIKEWVDKMHFSKDTANQSAEQANESANNIETIYTMIDQIGTLLEGIVQASGHERRNAAQCPAS